MSTLVYDPAMLTGVVAGLVVEVNVHPAGNFIRLATVDIGHDKVQIVFGGPDIVAAGDFVPVALPGARLPGRKKMRRTKFRGETSYGMLCSAEELGWEPGGPDEVALLKPDGLRPGSILDGAKWSDIQAGLKSNQLELRRLWETRLAVRSGDDVALDELAPV